MRRALLVGLLALSGCTDEGLGLDDDARAGADASPGVDAAPDGNAADAGLADDAAAARVFGVTVDDPWAASTADSLLGERLDGLVGSGGRKPTARVVFDEGVAAADYAPPLANIAPHAVVMGELLDSFYVAETNLEEYRARACAYRAALGDQVDVWEIGNEVNGEWLGEGVLEKLAAATAVFTADATAFAALCPGQALQPDEKPFRLAMTFYYNGPYNGGVASADNCWAEPGNAMERWIDDGFVTPGAVGTTQIAPYLDQVLVSYYEDDCAGIQPAWPAVFDRLGEVFPTAALGFGECGTAVAAAKVALVERYYRGMDLPDAAYANMHILHPRFVGGYFWWYFSEDLDAAAVYGALAGALGGPFWE
jgi:hypothetical protein